MLLYRTHLTVALPTVVEPSRRTSLAATLYVRASLIVVLVLKEENVKDKGLRFVLA